MKKHSKTNPSEDYHHLLTNMQEEATLYKTTIPSGITRHIAGHIGDDRPSKWPSRWWSRIVLPWCTM